MKKKKWMFFLFMLLLVYFAMPFAGADNLIYNEWHSSGDTIEFNHETFIFTINTDGKAILLDGTEHRILVGHSQCIIEGTHKYCYVENRTKEWNFQTDTRILEAHLYVYDATANLDIDVSIDKSSPKILEELIVTINVENDKHYEAKNIVLETELPSSILLLGVLSPQTKIINNNVQWIGHLLPRAEAVIQFKIFVTTDSETSFDINTRYVSQDQTFEVSKTKEISVSTPLGVSLDFSSDEIALTEDVTLTVGLENKYDTKYLTVKDLEISFSEGLEFIHSDEEKLIKVSENTYKLSTTLDPGTEHTFTIDFKTIKTGSQKVVLKTKSLSASGNYIPYEKTFDESVDVNFDGIDIEIKFSNDILFSEDMSNVKVYAHNLDKASQLSSIKADFESLMFSKKSVRVFDVLVNQKIILFDVSFKAPPVFSLQSYFVTVSGTYETMYGEKFSFSETKEVEVDLANKTFTFERTVTPTDIKGGEKIEVSVDVTNVAIEEKYVYIYDIIPAGFSPSWRYSPRRTTLVPKETRHVYTYILTAPERFLIPEEKISTVVEWKEDGVVNSLTDTTVLTLASVPVPEISLTREFPESLALGDKFEVKYVVENKDAETMYNLKIAPTLNKDYDVVFKEELISELASGDKKEFSFYFRPKKTGSILFPADTISFEDFYDMQFNVKSSEIKKDVAEKEKQDAFVFVTKSVKKDFFEKGENVTIYLSLTNQGTATASYELYDSGKKWLSNINPGQTTELRYSKVFDAVGTIDSRGATIKYFGSEVFTTSSNNLEIRIVETTEPDKDTASETDTTEKKETKDTDDNSQENAPENDVSYDNEEKKNIFMSFVGWFVDFFDRII